MSDDAHRQMLADGEDGERPLQRYGLRGLRAALSDAGCAEMTTGWLHFWRGYALQFEDLARARVEWLAAEGCFANEGDRSGLDLAACGLVQCTLFDTQSYVGFEERAKRVEQLGRTHNARTPLVLFGLAARLLLTSERRENVEGVTDDIDRHRAVSVCNRWRPTSKRWRPPSSSYTTRGDKSISKG